MKKIISFLLIVIALFTMTGCVRTDETKLEGKDLEAYNLMLEVCYVSSEPSKISVISGTVGETLAVFKVSYNNGEKTYNVIVDKKYGEYTVKKVDDRLVSEYRDLIYNTDSFNASKVNRALRQKWAN